MTDLRLFAEIDKWLATKPAVSKRAWFNVIVPMNVARGTNKARFQVYLRVWGRGDDVLPWTIDLANVEVAPPRFRGRGIYTQFVEWLYAAAKKHGYKRVRHENTNNERLAARHRRNGLKDASPPLMGDLVPTFVKDIT